MILALVLPRSTFWSFSFGTLLVSGPTPRLLLQWWEQPQHSGVNMNKSSLPKCLSISKSIVVDPSGVTFVTLDVVHAVIFYQEYYPVRSLFLDFWGDRCGREVPHFDSRPVSISDPRVDSVSFGPEPDGNGPETLACGPAAELTFVLLVWGLLPRRFLYAHQRTSRC